MGRFWLGFGSAVALLAIVGVVLVSGAYDVAASRPHTRPVAWLLDTTMHNSVERRSADREPPPFTAAQVRAGFALYADSCEHCHGAPGRQPQEWGRGMLPRPPALSTATPHWDAQELHWILKHGVKMSGMPAFGATYSDAQLWELVAFIRAMPQLPRGEYTALETELRQRREATAVQGGATPVGSERGGNAGAGAPRPRG